MPEWASMRPLLSLVLLFLPLHAQDHDLADLVKSLAPKLAERPAGPVAVFKFGGGRGTSSTLGEYLADQVGAQLLSTSKRQIITREQTAELGPPTQSRMAELIQKFHAVAAVTGNYTVLDKEVSVTIFLRDPVTLNAFGGESVTLPRTSAINSMLNAMPGEPEAESRGFVTTRRRSPVFRPEADSSNEVVSKPSLPTLARGTTVAVRLIEAIYSDHARPGQTFRASLDQDLSQDGHLIAPMHADALLEVVSWNGRTLGVTLRSVRSQDGTEIPVSTASLYREAKATKGGRAKSGLRWGAIGAAIGAVAGGAAGAAVGAGAGAGAGSTIDPGQKTVSMASETKLEFTTN